MQTHQRCGWTHECTTHVLACVLLGVPVCARAVLAKIGTKADTPDFRDRMHQEQSASTTQVKQVMSLLKQASSENAGSVVVQRLTTQFDREFKKFQQLNRTLDDKQVRLIDAVKENNRRGTRNSNSGFHASQYDEEDPLNPSQHRYDSQQQQQVQQQQTAAELDIHFIEYDVAELERRQVEIRQIEQDVLEVSEMYNDLHHLVNEQQEHIDTIDTAIVTTRDRTEEGAKQLDTAEEYQKKARKKQCCVLFLVLTIIAVIVVVVVLVK